MSDVRVSAWPLALVGSALVHVAAVTGLYLVPASTEAQSALMRPGLNGPTVETTPLYLIPDELPPEIAAKLQAEREAEAAKAKPADQPPKDVAPPPPQLAAKPKPPEPELVNLGAIDGPKKSTKAWLKNDGVGEHSALLSEVVQPQQDMNAKPADQGLPGQGGADGKAHAKSDDRTAQDAPATPRPGDGAKVDAAPRPSTADSTTPALAQADRRAAEQPNTAKPSAAAEQPMLAEQPRTDEPRRENPPAPPIAAQQPVPGNSGGEPIKPAPQQPQAQPAPATLAELVGPPLPENFVRPTPTEAAVDPLAAPRGGTVGTPSEQTPKPAAAAAPGAPGSPAATPTVKSDRDSDAANVKVSGVFRNGKVEAGEGLDIRTVRPEFSLTTRALRQPRSPVLEIVFGKDGRARSVRVLKSSGFPSEVDEPVVTALYNWRARGKVLDELPKNDDSSVALQITILLQ